MRNFIPLLFLLLLSHAMHAQFVVNGDAADLGSDCYRLTDNVLWQAGSVYHPDRIDLTDPFTIRVTLNFGVIDDLGADGIAFLMQPISSALGASGGGIGYEGITPSLAVEFDTHENIDVNDPVTDHIGIQQNGSLDHLGTGALISPVDIVPTSGNVENGLDYTVLISWDPATQTMEVEVDCSLRATYTGDIVANIFGGNPLVYVGFTGSTGGLANYQRVCYDFLELNEGPDTLALCLGDSIMINGPNGFTSYSWLPGTGLSDPFTENPIAFPTTSTLYTVTFTDACGQTFVDSFMVNVDPGPAPVFDLGADTAICTGNSLVLNGPASADSYLWSNGSTNALIVGSAGNTYWLIAGNGACLSEDTIAIGEVFLDVDAGADGTACEGDSVLIGPLPQAGWNYTWSSGATTAQWWASDPGNYNLAVDSAGCLGGDVVFVGVTPLPIVEVVDSASWCPGEVLNIEATGNASTWSWSNGETGPVLTQVSAAGEYYITGTLDGCSVTDTLLIYEQGCSCEPGFPNAFTPNGDTKNDQFTAQFPGECVDNIDFTLLIYDRWGQQVFAGSGAEASWDGSFQGQDLPMGTYVWVSEFTIDGVRQRESGMLTLLR